MGISNFNSFLERLVAEGLIASQKDLASILGIDGSAISQAKRRNSIPRNWVTELSIKFDLNPQWIQSGAGQKYLGNSPDKTTSFEVIPKVKARLSAGHGSFEVDSQIEGYYSFRRDWLSKKGSSEKMALLDIFGNSMEPEFKDGDTVLIDESQKEVLAGAVYAVGIDDTIMVKRVERHPNGLALLSDNPKYGPIYQKNGDISSVRIIGRVLWLCRELK